MSFPGEVDVESWDVSIGAKLAKLSKTGELELMYVHLQSMRNFSAMLARVTGDKPGGEFAKQMADLTPEGPWH